MRRDLSEGCRREGFQSACPDFAATTLSIREQEKTVCRGVLDCAVVVERRQRSGREQGKRNRATKMKTPLTKPLTVGWMFVAACAGKPTTYRERTDETQKQKMDDHLFCPVYRNDRERRRCAEG